MESRLAANLEATRKSRLVENLETMKSRLAENLEAMEYGLVEKMRDMQTELLRVLEAFSEGQTIRLRKIEADQSNLDSALSGRVNVLVSRLLQIDLRLGLGNAK